MIHYVVDSLGNDPSVLYDALKKRYNSKEPRFHAVSDNIAICCVKEQVTHELVIQNIHKAIFPFLADTGVRLDQIWLILNNTLADSSEIRSLIPRVTEIDYFACWCYHRHLINNVVANESWNSHSNRALFLLGKPYKEHRIGLLYELAQTHCFDKLTYSFNPLLGSASGQMTEQVLGRLGYEVNYQQFAKDYEQHLDLDQSTRVLGDDGIYHYTGFPYDPDLYRQTSVSVISETHYGVIGQCPSSRWITEKLWHPVLNRCPFVLIDVGNKHEYLKDQMGIKTYEAYYKYTVKEITAAHNKHGTRQSLKMWSHNVCHFLDNYRNHVEEISDITEHNYRVVESYYAHVLKNHFHSDTELYGRFFEFCAQPNL